MGEAAERESVTERANWELKATWDQVTQAFHINKPQFPLGILHPFPAITFPVGSYLSFLNLFLILSAVILCWKILPAFGQAL